MNRIPTFIRTLAVAGALLGLASGVTWSRAAEIRLRLLETSDIHMNLVNWDYYQDRETPEFGLAKAATLIKAARAEAPNSLLFDNGDLLQGSPLGDFVARVKPLKKGELHPAFKVLNHLGVDAANIGNHEFNFGLPFLMQAIEGARFPYVSANVYVDDGDANPDNDRPLFKPYVILHRQFTDTEGRQHPLKVGVIGFVPPQILQWDRQHLLGKVTARDMVESARRWIPQMQAEGADLIVAIPHSGFEARAGGPMAENSVGRLSEVPGLHALLFGHSHGEFPSRAFANHPKVDLEKGTINGIPAVMPGRWGDHLGVIDLTLDNRSGRWTVTHSRSHLRPIYDRRERKALVAADPSIEPLIRAEHQGTLEHMRARVATSSAPIHSYFAQVVDEPSVQLVSQAQLAYLKRAVQGTQFEALPRLSAAAPFKTGGRQGWSMYTDIPAGDLALRHIADLYVYPNTFKAVLLTGAQVREWLEMSAGAFARIDPAGPPEQMLLSPGFPSFNFDMMDAEDGALTYRIDLTQPARYDRNGQLVAPAARRIIDLRYKGEPLDDATRFLVATNNYRASGGGSFPGLNGEQVVIDAPDENREALANYLQAQGRIDPTADGNWRIQPVPGVKLRFLSGAGGVAHLARTPGVQLVQTNADGSALYELAP